MTDQEAQTGTAIVWFRDDLRLSDQPAFDAAARSGARVIALYVFDDGVSSGRRLGGASRWWLHHSLTALSKSLERLGGRLDILRASHADLPEIARALNATSVFWTRRYGRDEMACDAQVKSRLQDAGVAAHSFNGHLLREPWDVASKSGGPMKVFTPFWRAHQALGPIGQPLPAPAALRSADWPEAAPPRAALHELGLLPTKPDWAGGLRAEWRPGEAGARERLERFLDESLGHYADERDRPDKSSTSRLSPHLRFGEISPRVVLHAALHAEAQQPVLSRHVSKFLAEIGWREFSYHLLYANGDLATRNLQSRFDAFPWRDADETLLHAWRFGRTGYPIVDAGMRELWSTGYMHNRVRMIVASFLIKHLLIDWRIGEEWFWDTLCDADPAANSASWQWVAGSGADAAPFFRIFNPILQGEKFDAKGDYVRRFVPELADVPAAFIHKPWTAPSSVLDRAGVRIPQDYPAPIVDHAAARARALKAFAALGDAPAQ